MCELGIDTSPRNVYYILAGHDMRAKRRNRNMTIKQIRDEFKEGIRFSKRIGSELVDYQEDMQRTFEELWKYGFAENFSDDFLRFANGYQINTGNYSELHINQTFDLRSISASKAVAKDMMITFLR